MTSSMGKRLKPVKAWCVFGPRGGLDHVIAPTRKAAIDSYGWAEWLYLVNHGFKAVRVSIRPITPKRKAGKEAR